MRNPAKRPVYNCYVLTKRLQLQMTQAQLAKHLHVSRQTINAIENQTKKPSLHLAIKLADFFHTSVEDLFRFL